MVTEVERASFDEFDACADALLRWEIEAVQLDRGAFEGRLVQASSPIALVSEMAFGRALHQRGEPPRGMRTLGVPADPAQRIFFQSDWAHGDQLLHFPLGSELDSVSLAGFHVFSVSYEEERVSEICQACAGMSYEELLAGRGAVRCTSGALQSVRDAIRRFLASPVRLEGAEGQADFVHRDRGLDLLEAIVDALMLDDARCPPEPYRARSLAVRRSLDRIEACGREPLSVVDLSRAARVSRRTLEYAFQERFGLSPKAYMLTRRLHGVRAELRQGQGELSITRIANRWGFDHLSRFAAFYRRQFGELPSETVRARRCSLRGDA